MISFEGLQLRQAAQGISQEMAVTPVQDRRSRRTVDKLARALIALSLDIGYDRVSVRQLAREVDVSHTTFYRHFRDKHDLLMRIFVETFENILQLVGAAKSPRDEVLLAFRYIRANPDPFRLYVNLPASNLARSMSRDMIREMMLLRYQPQNPRNIPSHIAIDVFIAATDQLLAWYLNNLKECSPERMTEFYLELVIQAITHSALEPRQDWMQRFP